MKVIDKVLIEKYLRGECSGNEAAAVGAWLQQHPDEVEKLLPEEEWDKQITDQPGTAFDEEMYQQIEQGIRKEKRKKLVITSVISAAVLFLLIAGIRYFNPANTSRQETVAQQETIHKNTGGSDQVLMLPDSTMVTLAAGSEIRYTGDYNYTQRNIYLTGKAEFSVARNKQKQFTVFCGKVATTALGTRFSVNGAAKSISVILFEGKVVVRKIQDETVSNFLSPGDKISYNIRKEIFELVRNTGNTNWASHTPSKPYALPDHIEKNPDPYHVPAQVAPNQSEPAGNSSHINFQNQNLKSVLSSLAERFKVEINYPTEIASSINVFISVDTTQSIDKILLNIAAVNNLEVKKVADNVFYISK